MKFSIFFWKLSRILLAEKTPLFSKGVKTESKNQQLLHILNQNLPTKTYFPLYQHALLIVSYPVSYQGANPIRFKWFLIKIPFWLNFRTKNKRIIAIVNLQTNMIRIPDLNHIPLLILKLVALKYYFVYFLSACLQRLRPRARSWAWDPMYTLSCIRLK